MEWGQGHPVGMPDNKYVDNKTAVNNNIVQ